MICTFFGHRDAPETIKNSLKSAIIRLIDEQGVRRFYVGNNGNFDFLAQRVLEEISKEENSLEFAIVLSSPCEKAVWGMQEQTLFPEGLEFSLPRFAISKRNDWLIKNSDFVIAYVKHSHSNAYRWVKKAERRGLKVISISDSKK